VSVAEDSSDESIYLFALLDDARRNGSFRDLVASEMLHSAQVLDCYSRHRGRVYVSRTLGPPGVRSLDAFIDLVVEQPRLFSPRAQEPGETERLAAVYIGPTGSGDLRISYLAGLTFRQSIDVDASPIPRANVVLEDLRPSETQLARLHEAIQSAEPRVGYALELRRTVHLDTSSSDELQRLLEQRLELDFQIAATQSMSQDKPLLYRFTQRQLPQLADLLRAYPMRVLREARLKYAFAATYSTALPENEAALETGMHYVLVEPNVAGPMVDFQRLEWQSRNDRPTRFWLDP
jgi:hypothetical protein